MFSGSMCDENSVSETDYLKDQMNISTKVISGPMDKNPTTISRDSVAECEGGSEEEGEFDLPGFCASEHRRKKNLGLLDEFSEVYDELEFYWSPSILPDYKKYGDRCVSSETDSLLYVDNLQKKKREQSLNLFYSSGLAKTVIPSSEKISTNIPTTQKVKKTTVWEDFTASIEEALRNGNKNCPIPVPHNSKQPSPQKKTHKHKRKTRYSKKFNLDDYLANKPLCPLPKLLNF